MLASAIKKFSIIKGKTELSPFLVTLLLLTSFVSSLQAQDILFKLETEINHLINHSKPFVVSVISHSSHSDLPDIEFAPTPTGNSQSKTVVVKHIGSGLIYNCEGFIITKKSVIENSDSIEVILWNGKRCAAQLVGIDLANEVAILKAEIPELAPPHFVKNSYPLVGSWVLVLGNSMGVLPTVSFGLIRRILTNGLAQISVNVPPGAIGSPVFNLKGEILGIVAARLSPNTCSQDQFLTANAGGEGLVYLIPSLKSYIEQIIDGYKHPKGWLGVTVTELSNTPGTAQVTITKIFENSPAEKAKLQIGDVILKINQSKITNLRDLVTKIQTCKPKEEIGIELLRNGKVINKRLVLGRFPIIITSKKRSFGYNREKVLPGPRRQHQYLEQRLRRLETEIRQIRKLLRQR
ncbi:hypothetical protein DRQ15_05060 [candidate division KSB1 bacterium]|nr:MAG: hypothetical protein B5M50_00835 [candidate division KSB1 bacterium 4484_219]RKY91394.1 MAG: hypothetical protein DRQ15_05060 [candidate division KSB1 bacterium]